MTLNDILTGIQNKWSANLGSITPSTTLTPAQEKIAYNSVLEGLETVDPTKKPTVKHFTDLEVL